MLTCSRVPCGCARDGRFPLWPLQKGFLTLVLKSPPFLLSPPPHFCCPPSGKEGAKEWRHFDFPDPPRCPVSLSLTEAKRSCRRFSLSIFLEVKQPLLILRHHRPRLLNTCRQANKKNRNTATDSADVPWAHRPALGWCFVPIISLEHPPPQRRSCQVTIFTVGEGQRHP